MRNSRILHITDLHIADPLSSEEPLGVPGYRQYLRELVNKALATAPGPFDCIVATGDFIDRRRTANFEHATEVLHYLASSVGLELRHVAVCPGNHDVIWDLDSQGKPTDS